MYIYFILHFLAFKFIYLSSMVPFFIQVHKQWRQMFVGVAEGPAGIRVNFDTIHLKQAPSKYMHLAGLMDMFKSKIVS